MYFYWIGIAFNVVVFAFVVYLVWVFYQTWNLPEHAGLSGRTKFWHCVNDSWTILWTKICTVAALLVLLIDPVIDFLGSTEARDFIQQNVGNPKVLSFIILAITAVTYFARMRSISTRTMGTP